MRLELDNVIQCLSLNGYSVFSLIDDILACREDERIKLLQEGIERELRDAADICARLLCFDSVPTRVLKYGRVQFKIRRHSGPIDMLPDNALLEIFNFCLLNPTIFWVQRTTKWQALIHYGTRVRKSLPFWPTTLPLTIDYSRPFFTSHRVLGDEDNIFAALEHPDRVHRIVIHAAGPLLSEVTTVMQESFPALNHLDLEWDFAELHTATRFSRGLPIPKRFLGGSSPPLLLHLLLKRIFFPQLPTFLLSAHNLVTLELNSISENDYISTKAIVISLATLTKLKTLSIMFCENTSPPDPSESRQDLPMQAILPALTRFHYRGCCEYLEDILAQINTPRLNNLWIEYFLHQIEAPQLSQFLDRTENLKLRQFRHAEVTFYPLTIGIQLDCSREFHQPQLFLDILDIPWLDEQVLCMADVLGQLVAMFPNIDHLYVHGNNVEPREMASTDWLPFFHLFQAVKALHLSGGVAAYIVSALEDTTDKMVDEVFPVLDLI
ncbi:hypothetical protein V8E53_010925 [Lactarius tabidus]